HSSYNRCNARTSRQRALPKSCIGSQPMNQGIDSVTVKKKKQNAPSKQDPARWRILAVLLVALFMTLVGVSIVNVTLPSIQDGLHASQSDIQWVLSGYAL